MKQDFPQPRPWPGFAVPVLPKLVYAVDLKTDDFVRLYNGKEYLRDEAVLFSRKAILGRPPKEIQELYMLAFEPTLICDAVVPLGCRVEAALITHADGQCVTAYRAIDRLLLSAERALSLETIAASPMGKPA